VQQAKAALPPLPLALAGAQVGRWAVVIVCYGTSYRRLLVITENSDDTERAGHGQGDVDRSRYATVTGFTKLTVSNVLKAE
jgi:hypothetical protein